jgi:hypothetical protein
MHHRFSALPSLCPPCSRSRESGVSEPTLVIWDLHRCRWIRFMGSALARIEGEWCPRLVARREVPGGGSWNLGRLNLRWTESFNIYRRRPVYRSFWTVHSTLWKLTYFPRRRFSALPSLHPPCSGSRESGVSEPTLVIWDLHKCQRIRFLGSALARPLVLFIPRVLYQWFLHLFMYGIHCK